MRRAAIIACALLALAACGKKGDPEPLTPDTFPSQYPKAEVVPELQGKQPAASAQQQQQIPSATTPLTPYQ